MLVNGVGLVREFCVRIFDLDLITTNNIKGR
jgi:hypothetical protein